MGKSIVIVYNHQKQEALDLKHTIETQLEEKGFQVLSYPSSLEKKSAIRHAKEHFLVISIGGDGTVLSVARDFPNVPILAINVGRLGFVTGSQVDGWQGLFNDYIEGRACFSNRLMLQVEVVRNEAIVFSQIGLNEVVVSSEGISRLVDLFILVDGDDLGRFRADGVLVATPTGSTAYSAAAGGPVMAPDMEAFVINPICPFTLGGRPVVTSGDCSIAIEVAHEQRTAINLTVDGQIVFPLSPNDIIRVRKAPIKCRIIEGKDVNFYQALREKLHWSGGQHD